jgi:hypothetical protein
VQVLCRERVEELEPSIRYCRYNMSKAGGSEAAGGAAELMEMAGKGPGQDLLQAKLQVQQILATPERTPAACTNSSDSNPTRFLAQPPRP